MSVLSAPLVIHPCFWRGIGEEHQEAWLKLELERVTSKRLKEYSDFKTNYAPTSLGSLNLWASQVTEIELFTCEPDLANTVIPLIEELGYSVRVRIYDDYSMENK